MGTMSINHSVRTWMIGVQAFASHYSTAILD